MKYWYTLEKNLMFWFGSRLITLGNILIQIPKDSNFNSVINLLLKKIEVSISKY